MYRRAKYMYRALVLSVRPLARQTSSTRDQSIAPNSMPDETPGQGNRFPRVVIRRVYRRPLAESACTHGPNEAIAHSRFG